MSFQPVDLQILFSHLAQGARSQVMQTALGLQQQAALGSVFAEKSVAVQRNVSSSEEMSGVAASHEGHQDTMAHDDSERKQGHGKKESHYKRIFDPQLGKHIDLKQ